MGREAAGNRLVGGADIDRNLDFGLVDIGPGFGFQPLPQHGAKRMMKYGAAKIHDQRPLRGWIEGKAEVDLVRSQVEDRISVSRLGIFKLDVEKLCDVVGHL